MHAQWTRVVITSQHSIEECFALPNEHPNHKARQADIQALKARFQVIAIKEPLYDPNADAVLKLTVNRFIQVDQEIVVDKTNQKHFFELAKKSQRELQEKMLQLQEMQCWQQKRDYLQDQLRQRKLGIPFNQKNTLLSLTSKKQNS